MTGPHTPRPPRPKFKIRLDENSPYVDLGVTYSELLLGMIVTLGRICGSTQTPPHPHLAKALDVLELHRRT